jgi:hypothetical protein
MTTRETIYRIIRFDGDGLPVVSAYVSVEPDNSVHTRVTSTAPSSAMRTIVTAICWPCRPSGGYGFSRMWALAQLLVGDDPTGVAGEHFQHVPLGGGNCCVGS